MYLRSQLERLWIETTWAEPFAPRLIRRSLSIEAQALQHTFTTNWVRTGKDLRSLSDILGHANVAFSMQQYVHSEMETKRAAMRVMSACSKQKIV